MKLVGRPAVLCWMRKDMLGDWSASMLQPPEQDKYALIYRSGISCSDKTITNDSKPRNKKLNAKSFLSMEKLSLTCLDLSELILDTEICAEGIEGALKVLKMGKSCGLDGVSQNTSSMVVRFGSSIVS